MQRCLPPFAAIRAFEAAARHLSIKKAADELALTPSAVSHQVRSLENYLGTGLFVRQGNRIGLTLTGGAYLGKLTGLLDALDETTREARQHVADLRVLCTPGFAARWLVPRMDRFPHGNALRLRVSEGAPDTNFDRNDADVVIHWGDTPVDGAEVEPLMQSARYPVVSPDMQQREGIGVPEDLLNVTLLHDEVMDAWQEWFLAAGIDVPDEARGPRFRNCEIATTAAERGQGIALAYDAVVRGTLESGSLVRLFDSVTIPIVIYSVAYRTGRKDNSLIKSFRDWLFAETANDNLLVQTAH